MTNLKAITLAMLGLGALALTSIVSSHASAQPAVEASARTLSVTGTAVVHVRPDNATLLLGASKTAPKLADAKAACDAAMAHVDAALRAAGVKPQDIQTASYQIVQTVEENKKNPRRLWKIEEVFSIEVRDVQSVSRVLDGAVSAGATEVQAIQFGIEDLGALRSKARAKAVETAKAKASELAREMGVTLGEPTSIMDQTSDDTGATSNGNVAFVNSLGGSVDYPNHVDGFDPIRSGQLTANARVDVQYSVR